MIIRNRAVLVATAAIAASVVLASCGATQSGVPEGVAVPGFLYGFWHGLISPISFIVSLFSKSVRIYAYPNNGLWYDFGFMLGISGFSGGFFAHGRRGRS